MGGGEKEKKVRQQSEGYSKQMESQEKWGAGELRQTCVPEDAAMAL